MNAYSYTFQDDNKAQEETYNGDVVHGSYSLIELEGSWRTVSYAADSINGFNAVVQRDPDITVKTILVAAPLPAATLYSMIAGAAPATIVVDAPLLRQPFISGSTLAATNVVVVNSGLFIRKTDNACSGISLQQPWKLFATLRGRSTESTNDRNVRCRHKLVQYYPKLPDLLNSSSESRMMVCPTRILSSPIVSRIASVGHQQRPVRKTIPLVQHSSSFVATRIELPVVDITCNYNSYRYKSLEESLKKRYGANYPPGEVVLNYIQLNTPDSRTRQGNNVGDDLLDFFNNNDTGTYSSSVSMKLETEYLNLLDHFVLRERRKALTAGKFTETLPLADERNLELSSHVGTWSQSTLRSLVVQEREFSSSGNQRPLKDKRIMIPICLGIEYNQAGGTNRRLSSLQRVLRR
ncbi:CUA3A protein, partial [Pseudoatta argentina]